MPFIRSPLFRLVERLSRFDKKVCLACVDIMLAPVAFLIASTILYNALPGSAFLERNWPLLILLAGLAGLFVTALKMQNIKLNAYESRGVLRSGAMVLLVTVSFALIANESGIYVSRLGSILFAFVFFLLVVVARFAMLHILRWVLREGQPRRRVLIYGAGRTGTQLRAALRSHDSISPVAYIDDNPALRSMSAGGLRIYGSDRIAELTAQFDVDRVLLAMPSVPGPKLAQIARRLQAMGLTVMSVPSFAQLVGVERLVDALTPIDPDKFLGRMEIEGGLPLASPAYQGRTVLVSGAGGSVGTALCCQLLQSNPACIVLFEISEIALYTVVSRRWWKFKGGVISG